MKKNILYLLLTISLTWQGLSAQSVASGSRLNMTVKKKAVPAESLRFAGLPAGLSYKPLSLQNPKALNIFYRSFLFSNTAAADNTSSSDSEIVAKNIDKRAASVESAIKSEEQLYASDKITVSNIYPNPASEYAEIDYNMSSEIRDAKLIFYNVLGSKMDEYALTKNNRKLRVDTTVMPTGLYFYQLSLEGKKVATKKMLVRHQQ
ncbi:T9SS type A sorting domain-containing protein [Dyadobacter psychrotolerans]|uniref:T9SS type A sorting domain-containing protein n=1 Tax=Dyadobacter psychrotolerans TaxID=2541721 RepID=A0A4R5DYV8_9BACT|nr:T9SS type A sorting domain-containing protein [Dyadobacter psychrotolerans]TDE16383.1 T9SS type A sorting domain-containing protein [Dyadobacter psychrotolerans]